MRKADNQDRAKVVDILCKAFIDVLIPNSINFVVKKSGNREKRLKALMEYQFDISMLFGKVFLSDDEKGCVLYLENKGSGLKKTILEAKLLFQCIGVENIFNVLTREKLLSHYHPKEKFVHLWLMGVIPTEQGTGIGTKLLQETLELYEGELIYVETTTPENRAFYKKNGFTIFHETFELDYPLYFLKYV
ncbi:GNAT family N-acetyltransferase [Chryseobacterium sp. MYb264]|uniref:GNAT family N-acetyltransferase n=1 Tax=Chryseobacterium sp. MYb264 TaxID=2745153 RepID=UPI002E151E61|nr:GNAT family N-acetyltransferase [Chryseobacterium sp. MYb264]